MVDNENMVMPVVPMSGTNNNGGFGSSFGGDGWWIILLFILLGNGGWGMGGFGGGWGMMNGMLGYDFPWLMTGQQNINTNTNNGFRDAMLNDGITSIRDGISGLSTQLCGCCGDVQMSLANGFSGVNSTVNSGFANAETAANARQMANMQQAFASQTAITSGLTGIQSQLAQCCCDNRLATESLRATVLQENCQDRYEAQMNARDIITNATGNTQAVLNAINSGIQSIKDDLCADRLEGYKRENDNLRTQLGFANLQASQTAQNSTIVDSIYNRLSSCPVGTTPVYGNQPIFTCPQTVQNNCGCGCNGGF